MEVKQVHVGGGFKCRAAFCLYYLQTKQNDVRAQANISTAEQSVTAPVFPCYQYHLRNPL